MLPLNQALQTFTFTLTSCKGVWQKEGLTGHHVRGGGQGDGGVWPVLGGDSLGVPGGLAQVSAVPNLSSVQGCNLTCNKHVRGSTLLPTQIYQVLFLLLHQCMKT